MCDARHFFTHTQQHHHHEMLLYSHWWAISVPSFIIILSFSDSNREFFNFISGTTPRIRFLCVGRCVREGNDIFYLSLPANSLFGCCQYYYPSLDLELGPVNTLSEWVQSRTLVVERERQRATQDTGKHFPDTQWNDMARLGQVLTHGVLEYTTIQRFGPELRDGSPNSWQNTPARAQSKQLKLERSPLVLSVSMHEERFSVFVNGIFFMIRWIK